MTRPTRARATHDPGGWTLATIGEGISASAKTLPGVTRKLRAALELPETAELEITYPIPSALQQQWNQAEAHAAERDRLQALAARTRHEVVSELFGLGFNSREIATMLGHTHQNILLWHKG